MIGSARASIVEHARTRPAAMRDERAMADMSSSCPGQHREGTPTDIHREAASDALGALAGCLVVRPAPDPSGQAEPRPCRETSTEPPAEGCSTGQPITTLGVVRIREWREPRPKKLRRNAPLGAADERMALAGERHPPFSACECCSGPMERP